MKAFLSRDRIHSAFMFPISEDNAPLNMFLDNKIYVKEDMLKMVDGKGPDNLFELMSNICNLRRWRISSGIIPIKLVSQEVFNVR